MGLEISLKIRVGSGFIITGSDQVEGGEHGKIDELEPLYLGLD